MVLTLEQKMARMQLQVLTATDDAHLTAEQLKQKNDTSLRPHSPSAGLKARHSAMHTLQHTQSFSTLRCFACDTALRDPGVGWFSCGACGALNGEDEPRISRAFDGCIFRGMCRRLSRHGRLVVLAVLGIIGIVIYEGVTAILPILVDESPWTRASLMHGALTAFLAAGTVFNYGAAVLTSPGYVTTEINPLRLLEHEVAVDCGGGGGGGGEAWSAATSASSGRPAAASTPCKRRGDAAAAAAAAAARDDDGVAPCELSDARSRDAPPLPSALPSPRGSCAAADGDGLFGDGSFGDGDGAAANGGGSCGYGGAGGGCGGGGGGGGGGSAAADTPLARLVALRGEQPLRGWKRCRESGVSMPPRSHYCRTSRAVVLRMDHFCMFTNGTIGHRNHHYFLSFLGFAFAATLYALAASGYAVAATAPPRAALLNGTDLAAAIGHHPAVHALAAASAAPAAAAATAATLADGATRQQQQQQQQPQQPRQPQEQPPQEQQGGRLLQQAVAASPYGLPGAIALGGLGPAGLPYGLLYRLFSGLVVRWPLLGSAATLWCACLPTALFTGTLLLVQLRNLRRGLTYIESCRTPPPTEYDLGPRRNFGQVFGSWSRRDGGRRGDGWRTLLHLLPVPRPPVGDGVNFPTRAPVRRV